MRCKFDNRPRVLSCAHGGELDGSAVRLPARVIRDLAVQDLLPRLRRKKKYQLRAVSGELAALQVTALSAAHGCIVLKSSLHSAYIDSHGANS
jgi:hypothetical protein